MTRLRRITRPVVSEMASRRIRARIELGGKHKTKYRVENWASYDHRSMAIGFVLSMRVRNELRH